MDFAAIRKRLARWYEQNRRDLPWRRTRDPYAIWISEIMLQQTRVAAVIPYYERLLARFPDAASLARAGEDEVLALWSGLGYYSRARNMLRAAKKIASAGAFPSDYASIRALPGIGDYTAAAIASIAFDLPYAVVDGNVRRVAARIANDARVNVQAVADGLLDRKNPGRSNQALMELGAVICLPLDTRCSACPITVNCEAHKHGTQKDLPPRRPKAETVRLKEILLVIQRRGKILLTPSARVHGFWDLPQPFQGARIHKRLGMFRHAILNRQYSFEVCSAFIMEPAKTMRWCKVEDLHALPLSTTAKKALRFLPR
ncbi:MAG: A/G-specific adenine glycosylase [Bryobacterales bacterium]|nr:A/G-specific adenine glycosylase [Bryobacterales bacterium]MBV9400850.1 A/G-specific adenine glycosylase [Bryobacterales bacterium]